MTLLQQALQALEHTMDCLRCENEKHNGAICDTIWYDDHTTLFDFISSEIGRLRAAIEAGAVVQQPIQLTDEQIEKLAVEHESFGFGLADSFAPSTHGFDPVGLISFARAILAPPKEKV